MRLAYFLENATDRTQYRSCLYALSGFECGIAAKAAEIYLPAIRQFQANVAINIFLRVTDIRVFLHFLTHSIKGPGIIITISPALV